MAFTIEHLKIREPWFCSKTRDNARFQVPDHDKTKLEMFSYRLKYVRFGAKCQIENMTGITFNLNITVQVFSIFIGRRNSAIFESARRYYIVNNSDMLFKVGIKLFNRF